jgi:GTPase
MGAGSSPSVSLNVEFGKSCQKYVFRYWSVWRARVFQARGSGNPTFAVIRMEHRAGFVAIIGKPNAGKSTLLNALLGQKIAIVTPKAQTTRHRIAGFLHADDYQLILVDTPGVIVPKYKLHDKMMDFVGRELKEADVVLWLAATDERFDEVELIGKMRKLKQPIVLVMNKADLMNEQDRAGRIEALRAEVPGIAASLEISALRQEGLDELVQTLVRLCPENPAFYDKDQITDLPMRFLAAEVVREKIFLFTEQEIPYSTEVSILMYNETPEWVHIEAEIHVERQSQKGMVIGKGGQMLGRIGTAARQELEEMLEQKVVLKLHVRVSEGWKEKENYLRSFGYK